MVKFEASEMMCVEFWAKKLLNVYTLNEASWSRTAAPNTKKIKYMEGLQINIAKFYIMAIYELFTYKPNYAWLVQTTLSFIKYYYSS